MKFGKKEKYALIIGISILIIIIIFGLIFNHRGKQPKPNIPYNTKEANEVQNEIDELYAKYKESDNVITYTESKNNDIYSILITIEDNSSLGDYIIPTYISYNYDTKTNSIITNEQLANYYGYTLDTIYKKIESRFKSWYEDEIRLGYVEGKECNFEECYLLYYRNINSLDEYELFVKDNKLYAYIGFDMNSFEDDLEYFNNLGYDPFIIEL